MFKTVGNEFTARPASKVEDAKQLLEAGFEYVAERENIKLFCIHAFHPFPK